MENGRSFKLDELWNLMPNRLEMICDLLHVQFQSDSIFPTLEEIFTIFSDLLTRMRDRLSVDQQERLESLLYVTFIDTLTSTLAPWGVQMTDDWIFDGFKSGKLTRNVYLPTNDAYFQGIGYGFNGQRGGDFHKSSLSILWDRAVGEMSKEAREFEALVPQPPNLESASWVVIPIEISGIVYSLALLFVNDISRVHPDLIERARKQFKECVDVLFIAPDENGKNHIWVPKFADSGSVEFQMSVVSRQEPVQKVSLKKYISTKSIWGDSG
ncbi:MAG: hypothetical protein UX04_C0006G0053 [Microgenomates group bacterium GW2011_GWF2_45_18]|nr:MAG: hypothetical protein UW18_C0006G0053 [Microgenomates group bacterium GW2011_GWF1_44_10]KKU01518.1 MAG: hypothetical protein UX04_C0006G0053 [Microgenomates group bacterium GW2011_GWF2_45_18]